MYNTYEIHIMHIYTIQTLHLTFFPIAFQIRKLGTHFFHCVENPARFSCHVTVYLGEVEIYQRAEPYPNPTLTLIPTQP